MQKFKFIFHFSVTIQHKACWNTALHAELAMLYAILADLQILHICKLDTTFLFKVILRHNCCLFQPIRMRIKIWSQWEESWTMKSCAQRIKKSKYLLCNQTGRNQRTEWSPIFNILKQKTKTSYLRTYVEVFFVLYLKSDSKVFPYWC